MSSLKRKIRQKIRIMCVSSSWWISVQCVQVSTVGHGPVPCTWEDLFLSKARLIFRGQLADCWETGITFSTSFHGSRVANCMLHASGIQWLLKLGFRLTCTPSWSFWSHWGNMGRAQNLNLILETWSGQARVFVTRFKPICGCRFLFWMKKLSGALNSPMFSKQGCRPGGWWHHVHSELPSKKHCECLDSETLGSCRPTDNGQGIFSAVKVVSPSLMYHFKLKLRQEKK